MAEVVHARCCGLDVHKDTVVACLLIPTGKQTRTFGTTTGCLQQLIAWLQEAGCTHVAMESTGVFWKPIYNLLEETAMTALVVNPQKIKAIPGRKTDVKDAEWIATLLRRDMLPASFIPNRDQRELQELVRYRQSLIQERTREANRMRLPWVEAEPPGPTGNVGGSQCEAGVSRVQYHWGVEPGDVGGDRPWGHGSRRIGPSGPPASAGIA